MDRDAAIAAATAHKPEFGAALAKIFDNDAGFPVADFDRMHIGDEGCRSVAEAMKHNTHVRSLFLRSAWPERVVFPALRLPGKKMNL